MLTCSVDLDFFRGAVAKTVNTIQVGVLTASRKAAQDAVSYAKASGMFQDRTGKLRDRIYCKYQSGTANGSKWAVISPATYSMFVEKGTRPHIIRPKLAAGFTGPTRKGQNRRVDNDVGVGRGYALRWQVGGRNIFARIVHHPGAKPMPFMEKALVKAKHSLWREVNIILNKVDRIWDAK